MAKGAAKAVYVNVTSKTKEAARARSSAAIFVYTIAGFILLYILLSRQTKWENVVTKASTWFSKVWKATTLRGV
jgi:hypothetical protein